MDHKDAHKDFIRINRKLWNDKTAVHVHSDMYDVPGFLSGKSSLNDVELELLGDIRHKPLLHLQCHFGMDSISLARLGADVTGVDLSDASIEQARVLAKKMDVPLEFICCNIYDLKDHLHASFDIVFTSYGTIGWLPDLKKWAGIVDHYLKPGGTFIIVEFHPVVWMFDDHFKEVAYSYFNVEPIVEETQGTYADRRATIVNTSVSWNHPLSEVMAALLGQNLRIEDFQEYDYSPYNCFHETVQIGPSKYRIKHLGDKIPMLYSIVASKPSNAND